MQSTLLEGLIYLENYSQTQIKLSINNNGFEDELFFDKKSTTIAIYPEDTTGEFVFISTYPQFNNFYFRACNIVEPACELFDEFFTIVNGWLYGGINVSLNGGTPLQPLNTLNFIEGSNITITESYNTTTNSVDVTINSSGGGGGLPPDGTYGDVVVSGAGTVWTVTDDTSNQQVAVYEDSFLRGTRPALNFYDDGGPVSVTVTDDSINNRVDIEITSSIPTPSPIYLIAYDTNTQTAPGPNRGYAMTFDTTVASNEIGFDTSSAVRFTQDGIYNIQFSAQFTNNDNQIHDVDIWFALNGNPIPWSNSRFSIVATHGGDPGHHIAAWNYMSNFLTDDIIEIYWQTTDTLVQIEKIAASFDAPDTPSIILTIDKL